MKTCRTCRQSKPRSEFYRDACYADKLKADCRACYSTANLARMRGNREKVNKQKRAWESVNRDKTRGYARAWREANKGTALERYRKWVSSNRGKRNALHAKRRAALSRAMPKWADLKRMASIYDDAVELTRRTGIKHHVDHFFPIQGEKVCGLHVPDNLQILTATANISKHNRVFV